MNKYIYCIKKLIIDNNLKVKFSWVAGKINPADFWSRDTWLYRKLGRVNKNINVKEIEAQKLEL